MAWANYRSDKRSCTCQHGALLNLVRAKGFNYDASAAEAKEDLRQRLIEACQKNGPRRRRGPLA